MSKVHTYARNLAANWMGHGANLVVMFLLSPFVVHTLGDAAYGVWSLLTVLTGYLGLIDLGVRGSTGRYINFYLGTHSRERVGSVVATSLVFYTFVSLLIFAIAVPVGLFFGQIFTKVPPDLAAEAKWVLLLLGANVWVGFFSATFSQLLQSKDRFDLTNGADILVLAIRTGGTVLALLNGYGLIALALVQVLSGLVGCAFLVLLARWKGPALPLSIRSASFETFREIFAFSVWVFVGNSAGRIVYYANAAVIGLLIGAKEITYYSIGLMLVEYSRNLINHVGRVMTPETQKAAGRADLDALRWLMVRTTRATMFVAVPLLVGMVVLGREFISLWMGPAYRDSASVLIILSLAQFGATANSLSGASLLGLGHVKPWACMAAAEAILNLGLSVGFVLFLNWGIFGVALGSLLPAVAINNILLMVYTCKVTKTSVSWFVRATVLRWGLAAVLTAALGLAVSWLIPPSGWWTFVSKVAVLCLLYVPIGLFVVMTRGESAGILRAIGLMRKAPIRLAEQGHNHG